MDLELNIISRKSTADYDTTSGQKFSELFLSEDEGQRSSVKNWIELTATSRPLLQLHHSP